jgi:hypothetical protein
MKGKIVEGGRTRSIGGSIAAAVFAAAGLVVLMGITGCAEGPRIVGAQREFEEQAERARENADERQAAHRRALRIQREMRPLLRHPRHPAAGCEDEYGPIKPRGGIEPVACGNFGSWPLTVARGYLRCEPSIRKNFERVIFTAPDGSEYAVNTSAHGVGYLGIEPILKRGKMGSKPDLDPLIQRGLRLCRGRM